MKYASLVLTPEVYRNCRHWHPESRQRRTSVFQPCRSCRSGLTGFAVWDMRNLLLGDSLLSVVLCFWRFELDKKASRLPPKPCSLKCDDACSSPHGICCARIASRRIAGDLLQCIRTFPDILQQYSIVCWQSALWPLIAHVRRHPCDLKHYGRCWKKCWNRAADSLATQSYQQFVSPCSKCIRRRAEHFRQQCTEAPYARDYDGLVALTTDTCSQ